MTRQSIKRTTTVNPTWCPGCGNFGIFGAIKLALDQLNIQSHELALVYDIGCSSNLADFFYSYGFHGLHGRALPVAAGIKLANSKLPVIAIIGDGGCFGEGISHFIAAARGNHDIVVLSYNNYLYSLTTGQMSPTSKKGTVTPSTPNGSLEEAFNPLATALVNHASFVSRGFAGNIPELAQIIKAAITHPGFAFVDLLQPCVTYNQNLPYDWYRKNSYDLKSVNHNPADFQAALTKALETDKLPIGIFYKQEKPTYHSQLLPAKNTILAQADISTISLAEIF
ncbi:MAG: thiamine pyrophosphate-dependent enzyme [Candidatus Beckwithbacteria bacterium]